MRYRFAAFLLDIERYELRCGGRSVELQPRPFDVLRHLVEQAPRTVPKEELLERVWAGVHTSEGVLTQAVSQLRRSLSEVPGGEAVVETVRGRGYRIAVPVESEGIEAAPSVEVSAASSRRRIGAWMISAALLLGLAGGGARLAWPPAAVDPADPSPESAILNPRAVAVLPFEDLGSDPSAYLGDALAEEIMSSLSGSAGLLVVARTSAFSFKGSGADVQSIGRRLGVAHVLEGAVLRRDEQVRVTAQLVDAATGFVRWSHTWERGISDLFAVQEELAAEVVGRVARAAEAVTVPHGGRRPRDFQTYDAYLRGMASLRLRDEGSLKRAARHFEEALARDPDYADAWAGLSAALGELWAQYSTEPRGGPLRTRANAAAARALELDPESAEAMRLLAAPRIAQGDAEGARALLERAHEIRPHSVEVKLGLAAYLTRRGELEPALELLEDAARLDPFSTIVHLQLGRVYFYAGDPEAALRHLERAGALSPGYERVAAQRSIVYRALGRREEAREAFLELLPARARPLARALARALGDERFVRAFLAYARLRTGDACIARPEFAAHVYAAIGEADAMFVCLRREVLRRHGWYIAVEPIYNPYRDDPRFDELLEAAGLERVEIRARERARTRTPVDGSAEQRARAPHPDRIAGNGK